MTDFDWFFGGLGLMAGGVLLIVLFEAWQRRRRRARRMETMGPFTKVAFIATAQTAEALRTAATAEGMSKTDVLNRAVQLYAYYVEQRESGAELAQLNPDGTVERLTLS